MNPTSPLQSALALSLLHSLWQIGVLALLAAPVLALLERRSAALRHAAGMGFLLAMALAPLATFAWLIGSTHAAAPSVTGAAPALPPAGVLDVAMPTAIAAPTWLPWLWCAGVLVMLVRLAGGWWMVRALDRQAFEPLPLHWQQRADALRRALGIRREVAIRLLHGVGLPCSARAWRPVVWLPVSMLTRLDPDQIEALIAHELAHIRRLDWIWNGLQCAIEALLFYHPGMWWLSRRIREERENACDDLAVAVCGDAIVLAEALATLERHRMPVHVLALSATGGALMHRVKRLLSPDRQTHQPARLRWAVPAGVLAVVCSGVLLAAQWPTGSAPVAAKTQPVAQATQAAPAAPIRPAEPVRPAISARVDSSGQSFQLSESRLIDGDRSYRASVDPAGKVTETYIVDGKPARIDADARQWITRMQVAALTEVPPAPPMPPLPPPPPKPAAPPMPPAPPPPPSLTSTAAYRAALHHAQQDAGVIALVGAPVRGGSIAGNSRLTDDSADLSFQVSGPKGTALVRARGDLEAGVWDIATLDLQGN